MRAFSGGAPRRTEVTTLAGYAQCVLLMRVFDNLEKRHATALLDAGLLSYLTSAINVSNANILLVEISHVKNLEQSIRDRKGSASPAHPRG
jgi:hypothetical protein